MYKVDSGTGGGEIGGEGRGLEGQEGRGDRRDSRGGGRAGGEAGRENLVVLQMPSCQSRPVFLSVSTVPLHPHWNPHWLTREGVNR